MKKVVRLSDRSGRKERDVICLNPGCHFINTVTLKDIHHMTCRKCGSDQVIAVIAAGGFEFSAAVNRKKFYAVDR